MARKTILIIGQAGDPHIERVSSRLRQNGTFPILFDLSTDTLELSLIEGMVAGCVTSESSGITVPFDAVCGVWHRLKQQRDDTASDEEVRAQIRFAWSEWTDTINTLHQYVASERWLNPVNEAARMCRKAIQHALAADVGLRIPDTSVTNDVDAVLRLFERHERLIYKPNRGALLTDCRCVFTSEVDITMIQSSAAEIALAPGIFQELIPKDHELRITIVGDKLFPVRMYSQEQQASALDWRRQPVSSLRHEMGTLDPWLSDRLMDFHRRAGLIYGAYDVIITKTGEPVFLEVNPHGQWMWMEDMLGVAISEAVADQLSGLMCSCTN